MQSNSRRRFLQTASAASLAAAGIGLPAIVRAQAPIALRVSSSMPANDNAAHYVWYQHLAANLKASVGDRIRIDFFPNNQLGKESDVVQQVKVGAVDMMVSGSSIWATVLPELGMLDLGYLFDGFDHVGRAMDRSVGASFDTLLQQRAGCSVVGWGYSFGGRNVFTKKPVHTLADIKGLKLRVLPTPAFMETFKLMGAVPTPIPVGELYMAAQTGVVDGFEHDCATVLASKFDEVVKSCWETQHVFSPIVAVMGRRALAKLPADLLPAFQAAARSATLQQRQAAIQTAARAADALKQRGMQFAPMSPADRATVRGEMQSQLYASFAKQYPATAPLFPAIAAARS
ncbi:TRAP transporter substrate-binding protein [Burkholderia sp. Ac-20379]|uniref:TRAP transporter substrate-binding protein n=1 Tax=Burkholderia sp. Ac-20379 TaxID=2703900 RepID=UPI00197EA0D3|nr:TRAP transporter substrate-binding protein [Burkholderia sp. Ac-20379]MBN3723636.1 TRAP transporter substrate-binding protein [Burkholderia sp. Ac-20379]